MVANERGYQIPTQTWPYRQGTPAAEPTHPRAHTFGSHSDVNKGTDIASASTITPPTDGIIYAVTGTTNITTIADREGADWIILIFDEPGLAMIHDTSKLRLRGNVNFIPQSGSVMGLMSLGGSVWKEIFRSDTNDGLVQGFEVILTAVAPPAPVDATATATGTSGVLDTILTAAAPPAPTVLVAVT